MAEIINVLFEEPTWWLLLCALAGVIIASLMYIRHKSLSEWSKTKKWLLWAIRALAVFLLAALLLRPYIRHNQQQTIQPIVLLALDNSTSIPLRTDSSSIQAFQQKWQALYNRLSKKYQVQAITFGSKINQGLQADFLDSETNIAQVIRFAQENFDPKNLGAILLATDGIYNRDYSPQYLADQLLNPIIPIALGDTIAPKDISIVQLFHNQISYLGDRFPVEVDLKAHQLQGKSSTIHIHKIVNGKKIPITQKSFTVNADNYFETFEFLLDAQSPGTNHYRISTNYIQGESSKTNNVKDFYIDVIDGRQSILIYSAAPHPDIGALRKALDNKKNYLVDIKYPTDQNIQWAKYNLVIFLQLPDNRTNLQQIIKTLNNKKIARLFVLGPNNDLANFSNLQNTISIQGNKGSTNEVTPTLIPSFNLFTIDQEWLKKLNRFPPLTAPFAQYRPKPGSSTLLHQKILGQSTNYPLIAFSKVHNIKEGVIAGNGIWKWRLFDHLEHQNQSGFDQMISSIVQYLTVKEDRRKFRSSTDKNVFTENQHITIQAELYNNAYELINQPEAFLVIKDQDQKEYRYTYDRQNNSYRIDIGTMPKGVYRALSTVDYNGVQLKSALEFSVEEVQLEQYNVQADHKLLASLAQKTNGRLFYPDQIDSLENFILNHKTIKPLIYTQSKSRTLISMPWLLALLIGLLALEWIIRRYSGSY